MIACGLAILAGVGVYLLITNGKQELSFAQAARLRRERVTMMVRHRLFPPGTSQQSRRVVLIGGVALFVLGLGFGLFVFAGIIAGIIVGTTTAVIPLLVIRRNYFARLAEASNAWPRMIEDIRVRCTATGKPIPQALLEVGSEGPIEYRDAFHEARRIWEVTTNFPRTLAVLTGQLQDPTADIVCETLLIAHELGGNDLDRRLRALHDDRLSDADARKDATARLSGVRFARKFVIIVPIGMALAGISIGDGRAAYGTASGQIGVLLALGLLWGCWIWAGQLCRVPRERRVLEVGNDSRV